VVAADAVLTQEIGGRWRGRRGDGGLLDRSRGLKARGLKSPRDDDAAERSTQAADEGHDGDGIQRPAQPSHDLSWLDVAESDERTSTILRPGSGGRSTKSGRKPRRAPARILTVGLDGHC